MGQSNARLTDLRLLGRHQIAAGIATACDFGLMVGLVELVHASPPLATLVSAAFGGVVNFTVARTWAFRERHVGTVPSQAIRYAAVSLGGALLNALLLQAVLYFGGRGYLLARAIISVMVSVAYTYPMHARVVFRLVETGALGPTEFGVNTEPELRPAEMTPALLGSAERRNVR